MKHNRRHFLNLTAGSFAAITSMSAAADLISTPRQTAGPFYPASLPLDSDNDLVQIEGRENKAKGVVANVIGQVMDGEGQPVADAKVEIWQCDANGRYHHPDDSNDAPLDDDFQAYGATTTDAQGRYRFRTIKPVPYPGRTPHIHFRVLAPGGDQLTTQMYIQGHAGNQKDGLFKRLGNSARQQAASAEFVNNPDDSAELVAHWNIVLG